MIQHEPEERDTKSCSTHFQLVKGLYSLSGTLPPDANDFRLFVTDGIRTEKVKVDLATTGWGDYVFAPTYRLRPLAEVEAFIKKHQHLPEVPSEQELQEKGLDLAEMHKIQMVKIEELTLYLLEQQKQIEALQNEIKQLKAKNHDLSNEK